MGVSNTRITRATSPDAFHEAAMNPREPDPAWAGRGIVICGGGRKYFPSAYVLIRMLRHHGCCLPIELWHLGPEEMPKELLDLTAPHGVECRDGLGQPEPLPNVGRLGWVLKAYGIWWSRFEEVMFLDADNLPLRDPEYLFDTAEYQEHGAMFWPDYGTLKPTRTIWELCGMEPKTQREFESGQMVIHKGRNHEAMSLALWMNAHAYFYYHHLWGDKDTFHMAWEKMGAKYHVVEHPVQRAPFTMLQRDPSGQVVFQHRNMAKWRIPSKTNSTGDNLKLHAECVEFVSN